MSNNFNSLNHFPLIPSEVDYTSFLGFETDSQIDDTRELRSSEVALHKRGTWIPDVEIFSDAAAYAFQLNAFTLNHAASIAGRYVVPKTLGQYLGIDVGVSNEPGNSDQSSTVHFTDRERTDVLIQDFRRMDEFEGSSVLVTQLGVQLEEGLDIDFDLDKGRRDYDAIAEKVRNVLKGNMVPHEVLVDWVVERERSILLTAQKLPSVIPRVFAHILSSESEYMSNMRSQTSEKQAQQYLIKRAALYRIELVDPLCDGVFNQGVIPAGHTGGVTDFKEAFVGLTFPVSLRTIFHELVHVIGSRSYKYDENGDMDETVQQVVRIDKNNAIVDSVDLLEGLNEERTVVCFESMLGQECPREYRLQTEGLLSWKRERPDSVQAALDMNYFGVDNDAKLDRIHAINQAFHEGLTTSRTLY